MADRTGSSEFRTDADVERATFSWLPVILIIGLIGLIMIGVFLYWGPSTDDGTRINSENTATRPAEP